MGGSSWLFACRPQVLTIIALEYLFAFYCFVLFPSNDKVTVMQDGIQWGLEGTRRLHGAARPLD